ncbi:ribulokinase [Lentisphaera araneosa HTCC2155]|uniref:Ribulokinase n=1 Tax=Lentisphaera araneosa HTCC2155 TaxID=313628 RepID=A6DG31_9BACT|nr:ribulokinase [Lentisphaera araneosa]EDM29148.1 ribulokinase [Lentisphaera araneosa HTCC2155]
MQEYAIGLDYGTNSCRSVLMEINSSDELFSEIYNYPSGSQGVLISDADPNIARQSPADYLNGMEHIIKSVINQAKESIADFSPAQIIGLTCATTGSTVIPVDAQLTALGLKDSSNLDAQTWLWKDHSSYKEAELITQKAKELRPQYLERCGGTYSSEWFWSKILHLKNVAPETFEKAYSFIELCDYLPAILAGKEKPEEIKASICAAGHKAMYADQWGGLPDEEFLAAVDPALVKVRQKLYKKAHASDQLAGRVGAEWAQRTGLAEGTAIAVGAFDAHMGAVGSGIKDGSLVKIVGTSTCDLMISPKDQSIAGVCGVAKDSVLPGYMGIEAGQSAVGDLFLWLVNNFVTSEYGSNRDEIFANITKRAAALNVGQSGLLSLDWNNGNRTVLIDSQLSGLLIGQTLHTKAHEIYRSLIEATGFGALKIIERLEDSGVEVKEVVCCGGLAQKNELMMQIYANIFNRPVRIAGTEQTCAVGAAIFAASAAGKDLNELQKSMLKPCRKEYLPQKDDVRIYSKLYGLYSQVHDGFGVEGNPCDFYSLMKELIDIQKASKNA